MQTAIVSYRIGSYSGNLNVDVDESDSNDVVIVKAKTQLNRETGAELPIGSVSFTIVERIDKP